MYDYLHFSVDMAQLIKRTLLRIRWITLMVSKCKAYCFLEKLWIVSSVLYFLSVVGGAEWFHGFLRRHRVGLSVKARV